MNRDENEIRAIENALGTLPAGCVTRKVISGSERFYLQWREDGRTRSRYLKSAEVEAVREQVRRRRALEERLKELRGKTGPDETKFETDVMVGTAVARFAKGVARWGRRTLFPALMDYLRSDESDRVFVVYGLRRTGKTTMLRQAILTLIETDLEKVAYVKVSRGNVIAELGRDLKRLSRMGVEYVFVDEVTLMADFIDGAALLSDVYAGMGMKIVLSGTDSLGFYLAAQESLYDRAHFLHTTYIPFAEHARLLGTEDVDEYIAFGGTLRRGERDFTNPDYQAEEVAFRSDESTRRYIDTAISANIQHSLVCCEEGSRFFVLRELYEAGELTGAINRVIEDMNHRFLLEVLTRDFKSHDFGSAAQQLASARDPRRRSNALELVDKSAVVKRLMEILKIRNRENRRIGLKQEHADLIREYLKALDLVVPSETEVLGISQKGEGRDLFVQPGMRFCQAEALVESLMRDLYFESLSEANRNLVVDRILDDVRGNMLEDIVLLETKRSLRGRDRAFKVKFVNGGEFDMVVYSDKRKSCSIYEVKHAQSQDAAQVRHLTDRTKRSLIEKRFGRIDRTVVLYRGETCERFGVEYVNVNDYLKSL